MRVLFRTGRGGRFYNGGHVSVGDVGNIDLGDIIAADNDLWIRTREICEKDYSKEDCHEMYDENGELIEDKLGVFNGSGNKVMGLDDWLEVEATGCGTLDIDGDYDTTRVVEVKDLDVDDLRLIADDDYGSRYIDVIVDEWAESFDDAELTAKIKLGAKLAKHFDDWGGFLSVYDAYLRWYEELDSEPTDDVDYCEINGKFYIAA